METLIGLQGPTFALVACDKYAHSSILRMKSDDDKLLVVDNNKVLGMAGQIGDRLQFGDYIEKNIHLFRFKHNRKLTCDAAANFTRQQLAYYLRRSPYHVDVLLAGHDEEGPRLYWIDYLASMTAVNKGAHGYAAYFLGGLLDRYYHPKLTEEEAIEIIRKCKKELSTRFLVSQSDFLVKIVNKDGVRVLDV